MSPAELPPPLSAAAVRMRWLARLHVAEPGSMSGYSRARFPHLGPQQGKSCDTREVVLARSRRRQSSLRTRAAAPSRAAGTKRTTTARTSPTRLDLDIDHMVPLAQAWRSPARTPGRTRGAGSSPTTSKGRSSSRSQRRRTGRKATESPDQWRPPQRSVLSVRLQPGLDRREVPATTSRSPTPSGTR